MALTLYFLRFTGQLTFSDPLQTLFQLLSGKTPTVSTVTPLTLTYPLQHLQLHIHTFL